MSRRFQFSLRWLLGLAAAVCFALGGWHLLVTYGQYVGAPPTNVGKPITVEAQLVRIGGPRLLRGIELIGDPPLDRLVYNHYVTERSWGCLYRLKTTIDPINRAGDYAILLRFQGQPDLDRALGVVTVRER